MTRKIILFLLIFISLVSSPCGCFLRPGRKARVEALNATIRKANEQITAIKTAGLIYPDVHLFQESPDARQEMAEWSEQATPQLIQALKREVPNHGITLKVIKPNSEIMSEMKNNYLAYREITWRLGWNATYRKAFCSESRPCPHYSVGKVARIMDAAHVDALLFVMVENEIETDEAKEAQRQENVKRMIMGAFGVFHVTVGWHPGLHMSMALVNRTGEVFWYSSRWIGKGYDLRDSAKAEDMTKRILVKLKAKEKK